MTTVESVQNRLKEAVAILRGKDYKGVEAAVFLKSGEISGYVKHYPAGADTSRYVSVSDEIWKHFNGTADEVADKAVAFARDARFTSETAEADYLRLLHRAIDFARERGLEEPIINPIAELAKKISRNAITDQRVDSFVESAA
ncbi:hypothetical protein [Pseudochelatococcus contaminans]|uniref:Uncharacterized protein n=1 Tax=Pseudochelatococcus contaminans TaxID=1538103 RepID=A0A7W6EFK0_9HYPH|nr:hypothetical protein [Pseudochelatococcus contaminans]MBB3808790.1 hypothetical protein [Pseudochelatococcus contaminans]